MVSTKEKGKTDQEKTKCNENAETGNQKKLVEETGNQKKLVEETGNQKKLVEEKAENDIKGKEKVHLKKQNDVGKVKKIKEAKVGITVRVFGISGFFMCESCGLPILPHETCFLYVIAYLYAILFPA